MRGPRGYHGITCAADLARASSGGRQAALGQSFHRLVCPLVAGAQFITSVMAQSRHPLGYLASTLRVDTQPSSLADELQENRASSIRC
jgi:hypothetical protein